MRNRRVEVDHYVFADYRLEANDAELAGGPPTRIVRLPSRTNMRQARPGILAVSITVAALMITSCTGRQSPLASFTPPTSVDPSAIQRISIVGNVIFNGIGQTGQFTATATFNNGSSKNVTPDGQWQSSDTHVATVSETGEAKIVGFGTCVISFEYEKQHAAVNVRASPPNTFTLRGQVRDPGSGGLPGVVVVQTSSGRSAVTDGIGEFVITLDDSPRRQFRLKLEKDGYETREVEVDFETREYWVDLPMQRVVRLAAGETVKPADLAPDDVPYVIGKDVCICRLIRVAVPRAGTVGVRVSWPKIPEGAAEGDTMHLIAEGVTVSGEDEVTADVRVSTAREVVMYFGMIQTRLRSWPRDYVAFTFETTIR